MWPICSQRVPELGVRIIPQPALHFAHHALAGGMQAQRDDARKAELLAVAPVEAAILSNSSFGQPVEAQPALLAGGIRGQRPLAAGELGMRAHQRELLLPRRPAPRASSPRAARRPSERPARAPRALGDPRRMLEHAAEARQRTRVVEPSAWSESMPYIIGRMLSRRRGSMQRCEALARHSELPGGLTRVFLSPEAAPRAIRCSAGCARPACRRSSTRSATRSAATRASAPGCPASCSARTSTRCATPASTTACSASSAAIECVQCS